MASGACTSGSTAHPRGATRRECGGAATTSTKKAERNRDGRDADGRRRDDVDGVDADAWSDMARHRGVFPCHVGRDDGGDDVAVSAADAVRYRQAVGRTGGTRLGRLTALVGM